MFDIIDEDDPEIGAICDLNYQDKLTGENAERFFKDCVRTVEREAVEREMAAYNEQYRAETDAEARKNIAQKIIECAQKINQIKKG